MKTYTVWHRHAHCQGEAGAWYPRWTGLTEADAFSRPRPVLGLCHILPDGEFPDGPVTFPPDMLPTLPIKANPELPPDTMVLTDGWNCLFAKLDRGIIKCPNCDNATFNGSIHDGKAVLTCTKCARRLG